MEHNNKNHYLLVSLGLHSNRTKYSCGEEVAEAGFAPLALLELMPECGLDQPDTVLCLLTEKAREKNWPSFSRKVRNMGLDVRALDIPDADNMEQLEEILSDVADVVEPGSRLSVDITHGPRHLPFVMYALALYLTSLRGVELAGAWYGKFESQKEIKPIISLKPLLELPRWFYAVSVFRDTGFTNVLAGCFKSVLHSLPRNSSRGRPRKMANVLENFSDSFESGFPLELGAAANHLINELESDSLAGMAGLELPLADELGENVRREAAPFLLDGIGNSRSAFSGDWKKNLELGEGELQRQARLIDRYLQHRLYTLAVGLMREWVVSLGIYHHGIRKDWLERNERGRIERALSALAYTLMGKSDSGLAGHLTDSQREWGRFWGELTIQRNNIAHNAMRSNELEVSVKNIESFWKDIRDVKKIWTPMRPGGGCGKFLVTAVGTMPGVLYSALKHAQPDSVFVVCTEKTRKGAQEAIEHARFDECRVEFVEMQQPFTGVDEIRDIKKLVRPKLAAADHVVANLTGGTTLMGVAVQALVEQCSMDGIQTHRLLLVDKRPHEEQSENPWVKSELRWLDDYPEERPSGAQRGT